MRSSLAHLAHGESSSIIPLLIVREFHQSTNSLHVQFSTDSRTDTIFPNQQEQSFCTSFIAKNPSDFLSELLSMLRNPD